MKKVVITAFVLGLMSFSASAQENETQQPERIKLYPSSHTSEVKLTPEQEIAQCEQQIAAIDAKEAWIRQSAEETEIATESGWFIKADESKKVLQNRIIELKK